MLPVLFGLIAALVFSFIAHAVYGLEGVMTMQWIDFVFRFFIFSGVAVAAILAVWQCLPCRLSKVMRHQKLANMLCENAPCNHY